MMGNSHNPTTGEVETGGSQGFLIMQPSLFGVFKANEADGF